MARIRALFWKDIEYRIRITTFLPIIFIVVLGIITNFGSQPFVEEMKGKYYNYTLSPVKSCEGHVEKNETSVTYEPSSPFLNKFMKLVSCTGKFSKDILNFLNF